MSTHLYRATVEEDKETGDLYFTIPPDALKSLGWKEDDKLEWTQIDSDKFQLTKIDTANT